jgi:AcrR family transcriptional regulator
MVAITGGAPSVVPAGGARFDAPVGADDGPAHGSTEARIADALLVCMGRWGLAKTTVGDIAREAGVSRATVYRLFPGGKAAISDAAALADVARLVELLRDGLDGMEDRAERLTSALCLAARFFDEHEALTFLRIHEPAEFERLVRMERLDALLISVGDLIGPVLAPVFDTDDDARTAAIWLGRLIASHVVNPSPSLDLTRPAQARRVVDDHVLAGFADRDADSPSDRPPT